MDETALARVTAFWETHCRPDAWNFTTLGLHNGDLYHFLSLLRPFRRIRGGGRPVRVLAASRRHLELANLFADRVDEVVYTPDLEFTGLQLSDWRVATGHDMFAPGEPIHMLPHDYFRPPLRFLPFWYNMNVRGLYYIHLMKLLLNLPLDIGPDLPVVTAAAREAARALFQQHGLIEGRSLVLFPFQWSQPAGFKYTHPCFAALAARATEMGLMVCTSVSPGEEPVSGTPGIFIPFGVLVPFCELAGYTVAWRSGITDVLATARCVKVGIYPSTGMLEEQNPPSLGLGGDERALAFDFIDQADPPHFANVVTDTLLGPAPTDGVPYVPIRIRELLALRLRPDRPNGFFRSEDFLVQHAWGRIFTSGVLGEGWSGVEPWGVWSHAYRSVLYLKPAFPASFDPAELGDRQVGLLLDLQCPIAPDVQEVLHYSIEVNSDRTEHEARWPGRGLALRIKLRAEQLRAPLRVTFTVDNPATPRELSGGKSTDDRLIGIGLGRVCYELIPSASSADRSD